jgi:hypothetical protein
MAMNATGAEKEAARVARDEAVAAFNLIHGGALEITHPVLMAYLQPKMTDTITQVRPTEWIHSGGNSSYAKLMLDIQHIFASNNALDVHTELFLYVNSTDDDPVLKFAHETAFNARLTRRVRGFLPPIMDHMIDSILVEKTLRKIRCHAMGGKGRSIMRPYKIFDAAKQVIDNPPDDRSSSTIQKFQTITAQADNRIAELQLLPSIRQAFDLLYALGKKESWLVESCIKSDTTELTVESVWFNYEYGKSTREVGLAAGTASPGAFFGEQQQQQPLQHQQLQQQHQQQQQLPVYHPYQHQQMLPGYYGAPMQPFYQPGFFGTPAAQQSFAPPPRSGAGRPPHDPSLCYQCGGPIAACPRKGKGVRSCTQVSKDSVCNRCNKSGHSPNYCRNSYISNRYLSSTLPQPWRRRSFRLTERRRRHHPVVAKVVQPLTEVVSNNSDRSTPVTLIPPRSHTVVVVDSGAGHSATSADSMLHNRIFDNNLPQYVGIGGIQSPTARGTLQLESTTVSGDPVEFNLPCRALPTLPQDHSLLAVSALEDQHCGFHVSSELEHASRLIDNATAPQRYISTKEGKEVAVERCNDIYVLPSTVRSPDRRPPTTSRIPQRECQYGFFSAFEDDEEEEELEEVADCSTQRVKEDSQPKQSAIASRSLRHKNKNKVRFTVDSTSPRAARQRRERRRADEDEFVHAAQLEQTEQRKHAADFAQSISSMAAKTSGAEAALQEAVKLHSNAWLAGRQPSNQPSTQRQVVPPQAPFPTYGMIGSASAMMTYDELHIALGHMGDIRLRQIIKRDNIQIQGRQQLSSTCIGCAKGKMTRSTAHARRVTDTAVKPWQGPTIWMDATGYKLPSVDGHRYVINIVDEQLGMFFPFFCSSITANNAIGAIKEFRRRRYAGTPPPPGMLVRMDAASGFVGQVFSHYLRELEWTPRVAPTDEHSFNGKAERGIRTCADGTSTLLHGCRLPTSYWTYAWAHYVDLLACCPTSTGSRSSYSRLGMPTSIKFFRPFGCLAYYRITSPGKAGFEAKARPGIYLGRAHNYSYGTSIILDMATRRIHFVRSAAFAHSVFPSVGDSEESMRIRLQSADPGLADRLVALLDASNEELQLVPAHNDEPATLAQPLGSTSATPHQDEQDDNCSIGGTSDFTEVLPDHEDEEVALTQCGPVTDVADFDDFYFQHQDEEDNDLEYTPPTQVEQEQTPVAPAGQQQQVRRSERVRAPPPYFEPSMGRATIPHGVRTASINHRAQNDQQEVMTDNNHLEAQSVALATSDALVPIVPSVDNFFATQRPTRKRQPRRRGGAARQTSNGIWRHPVGGRQSSALKESDFTERRFSVSAELVFAAYQEALGLAKASDIVVPSSRVMIEPTTTTASTEPAPVTQYTTTAHSPQRSWRSEIVNSVGSSRPNVALSSVTPSSSSQGALPTAFFTEQTTASSSSTTEITTTSTGRHRSLLNQIAEDIVESTGYVYLDPDDPAPAPISLQHILSLPLHHRVLWLRALKEEITNLTQSGALRQVSKEDMESAAIDVLFLFTIKKPDELGRVRAKCRMVVRGDLQPKDGSPRWDAPAVRYSVIKMAAICALTTGNLAGKFDIGAAFLHADLKGDGYHTDEIVYIRIRNQDASMSYYQLQKSVYGLRSAPGRFYTLIRAALIEFGLSPSPREPALFSNGKQGAANITVCMYVDDGMIFASRADQEQLRSFLVTKFGSLNVSGGVIAEKPTPFLGALWTFDYVNKTCTISQSEFISDIIKMAGMTNTLRPANCPAPRLPLLPHDDKTSDPLYLVLVGMVGWVAQVSRPDIVYAFKECARHSHANGAIHMGYVRRIINYLADNINESLTLRGSDHINDLVLAGWSDASYGECPWTRRSTSGTCITICASTIFGQSVTQRNVAQSSCEAELYAAFETAACLFHLRTILAHMGYKSHRPCLLHVDSRSAKDLVKRLSPGRNSKHVDVKFFRLKEYINDGDITLVWEPTDELVADALTKPLPYPKHHHHSSRIMNGTVFATPLALCAAIPLQRCDESATRQQTNTEVSSNVNYHSASIASVSDESATRQQTNTEVSSNVDYHSASIASVSGGISWQPTDHHTDQPISIGIGQSSPAGHNVSYHSANVDIVLDDITGHNTSSLAIIPIRRSPSTSFSTTSLDTTLAV